MGVSCVGKVMCPMQRMRKTCNVKLTIWRKRYAAHGEGDHHLDPSLLLGIQRILRTWNDRELCLVKLSPVMRNIVAIGVRAEVHYTRVLETRPWMKRWTRSLDWGYQPFTRWIEGASLPLRFNQPTFSLYNGRIDPVEHVSHFNQKMAVHSKDEALMCKIFPSSLGPMAMRWFNGLKVNSIDSFKKLTQAFGARFITCSRVPLPLGSLLSMSMREGETLKA